MVKIREGVRFVERFVLLPLMTIDVGKPPNVCFIIKISMPILFQVYQWKLLNHVSRDHNMTLKPAHLSYKCTVCTATFGMYKQFENHVYSAHSTVAKKSSDGKRGGGGSGSSSKSGGGGGGSSSAGGGGSSAALKPLKISDEITIIPQSASSAHKSNVSKTQTIEIE